jgi:hypothetical protein
MAALGKHTPEKWDLVMEGQEGMVGTEGDLDEPEVVIGVGIHN